MSVIIGSARIDENGKAHGGLAGDQTGREVSTQSYYVHSKGWRVFRAVDPSAAEKIARAMQAACDNQNIGYDQYERNTLYKQAEKFGFDVSKVTTPCETDCSALVRVCCAYAGIAVGNFTTSNEAKLLLATGLFVELTGSKYQSQSLYLGRGDILCTKTQGHTAVVLSNGSKFEGTVAPADKEIALGDRIICYGMEGPDVKLMQEKLLKLGYDLGKYGCDGDFGDCTELALIAFQTDAKIEADGKCGPVTIAALERALDDSLDSGNVGNGSPVTVKISGGNCYVRSAPNTDGTILGVAHNGDKLIYGGEVSENGWPLVEYTPKGKTAAVNAWVSGVYGKLVS